MPKLTSMLADAGAAGVALKFVADTPTITMSRLKAILTGGLPTFLDIGKSFSAAAITEDNLLAQMRARGMRVVVMGDDTWAQLLAHPHRYAASHPYPAFDVRDLHTVDDGVWQHLMPYVRSAARRDTADPPAESRGVGGGGDSDAGDDNGIDDSGGGGWDVLVAHYLGVDHAGHTYGGDSPEMYDKLRQMDEQVAAVAEELLAGAGDGDGSIAGPYSRTLLLVMGDHGQTMSGDHGGGSDEERDSVLLAFDVGRWKTQRQQQEQLQEQRQEQEAAAEKAAFRGECGGLAEPEAVSQIDLTPTLALLLGLPVPYGNLGRVNRRLWEMARHTEEEQVSRRTTSSSPKGARRGGAAAADAADAAFAADADADTTPVGGNEAALAAPPTRQKSVRPSSSYVAALRANAVQVDRYLSSYATRGGLPSAELEACRALLADAHQGFRRLSMMMTNSTHGSVCSSGACCTSEDGAANTCSSDNSNSSSSSNGSAGDDESKLQVEGEVAEDEVAARYGAFLEAAGALARRKFTRFDLPCMALGCGLMAGCVALHVWLLGRLARWRDLLLSPSAASLAVLVVGAAAAGLLHSLGLFSANWIQGEGRIQCVSLAAAAAALWLAAATPRVKTGEDDAGEGKVERDCGAGGVAAAAPDGAAQGSSGGDGGGGRSVDHSGGGCGHSGCGDVGCRVQAASAVTVLAAAAATAAGGRGVAHDQTVQQPSDQCNPPPPPPQPTIAPDHHHSSRPHHAHGHHPGPCQGRQQRRGRRGGRASLWWRSLLRHGRLAGLLAVALVCNFALQRYSLIDRWGSDPHDKRQLATASPLGVSSATAPPPSGAAAPPLGPALLLAVLETLTPLGLLPGLLAAALRPPRGDGGGAAASTRRRKHQPSPPPQGLLQRGWRRLQWRLFGSSPFQLASAWFVVRLTGLGDLPLEVLAAPLAEVAAAPLRTLLTVPAPSPPLRLLREACSLLLRLLQIAGRHPAVGWLRTRAGAVVALPLRLLLPRVVYGLAAAATLQLVLLPAAIAAAEAARGRLQQQRRRPRQGPGPSGAAATSRMTPQPDTTAPDVNGRGTVSSTAAAAAVVVRDAACSAVSSVTAVVALLLGRRGPAIVLLLWLHGLALFGLLLAAAAAAAERHAHHHRRRCSSPRRPSSRPAAAASASADTTVTTEEGDRAREPPTAVAVVAAAVEAAGGALLGALGTHAFFLTGHFCEFSGLQYDSPFVGFDHMTWPVTPALFLLNSFGATTMPVLALPLAAAAVAAASAAAAAAARDDADDEQGPGHHAHGGGDGDPAVVGPGDGAGGAGRDEGGGRVLLVALCLWRCGSLCVAVGSAALQRHHVVVWALFAPKLVFEVALTGATLAAALLAAPALAVVGGW